MTLIYCYDAWCGWCYGFSPVVRKIAEEYKDKLKMEVLSGGMIFDEDPQHIKGIASYVQSAYKTVEKTTGIEFGKDFLWHIFNPDESDWHPESTTPAIALCIFKEYRPDRAIQIASDFQYALNFEGRDLTDKEAYRHLLERYDIPAEEFIEKLKLEKYREEAYYEFALVKQLQVTGFPALLMQISESRFFLISRGYTDYETVKERIEKVRAEAKTGEP